MYPNMEICQNTEVQRRGGINFARLGTIGMFYRRGNNLFGVV